MARLVFVDRARRDLAQIAAYIERESTERDRAEEFIAKLVAYCERLAALNIMIGRSRHDIRAMYRSVTFGNYVIFFTYDAVVGDPIAVMKVLHVLWGGRDLDAYFRGGGDNE